MTFLLSADSNPISMFNAAGIMVELLYPLTFISANQHFLNCRLGKNLASFQVIWPARIYPGRMDAPGSANQLKMMPLVTVNGTVRQSGAGPSIGLVDIGINENAYFLRNLSCDLECDGTVHIEGVATIEARILKDSSRVFHMSVQQLWPPGPFNISFKLPGPVDPRERWYPGSNGNEIRSTTSSIKLGSNSVSFLSGAYLHNPWTDVNINQHAVNQ
ncbi:hypothetical protein SADUNF_Sadunf05G0195900 [Salix dunnii]|uniref:Uncharacterized protein n=1 Tax=Salix dunnii TaxID=1413687 RepID=A0A835K619_9ROSI|nr:hypothetical protein SADUNF_Sadunf05G0195900 [Salix dunnii]